ncbi:MAG TPA: preprotein translocase subunit YajC [Acidimicrobiia bacterium]
MQALLLIPLVAIPFFLLFVLPQRRQLRAVSEMQARIVPGDEIVTTSGIFGRIVSLDVDTAELEIAPSTTVTIARRAIGRLVADLPVPARPSVIDAPPAEQPVDDPKGERSA